MAGKVYIPLPAKISPANLNKTLLYFLNLSNFSKDSTLVEVIRSSEKGEVNQCFYILELLIITEAHIFAFLCVQGVRKGEISILLKT